LKALYWEGEGFVLLYKRLENGKFKWPRNESEAQELHLNSSDGYLKDCPLNNLKPLKRVIYKLYYKSLIS